MRWSSLFIPTLRDAPAEAEAASHRLLVRGGFIRQLQSGHYSMLPLGWRVHQKVAEVVRQEMDAIGAQEFLLPAMHAASVWQTSGRWTSMGDEMFRLTDRKGGECALGMTHEEVFATLSLELTSYRDLPQLWYQIQWKFRDEPRPKSGLLRVREFAMKDSYSFDLDDEGLDRSFQLHHAAYLRIFRRLDLDAVPVEASSGAMGGSASIEFMVESDAGEDDVALGGGCGYAANGERATAALEMVENRPSSDIPESFPTPGIRTINALAELGHPPIHQIKTLVYRIDGELALILLRGDHPFLEQKFADATGANEDDFHLQGVDVERDVRVDTWVDVRGILDGEACASCGEPLSVARFIEAGHIFKLGRKYSEAMGVSVLDAEGVSRVPTMGSYGIGVGRAMATVAETHHDDNGLVWPMAIAPYEVVLTVVKVDHAESMAVAESLYEELRGAGIDVLLDDRDGRAGVKFADAELVGIPLRVTIGSRGLESETLEVSSRKTGEQTNVPLKEVAAYVVNAVTAGRAANR